MDPFTRKGSNPVGGATKSVGTIPSKIPVSQASHFTNAARSAPDNINEPIILRNTSRACLPLAIYTGNFFVTAGQSALLSAITAAPGWSL